MAKLEELFPSNSVAPKPNDVGFARELLQLERQLFSAWMYWLTGPSSYRDNFLRVLEQVEQKLQGGFFLGDYVSYVDFMYAPFLERMAASLLYYKAFQLRADYPNINKWFETMETLEAYQVTKSDYYTHAWDLPPQLGGCVTDSDQYQDDINGVSSWEIPLPPSKEPEWKFVSKDQARLEVLYRLSNNHEAIAKFAARGAGRAGFPSYSAPLADPNASSNDNVITSVDAVLRIISTILLDDTIDVTTTLPKEEISNEMKLLADKINDCGEKYSTDVVNSLIYLRDRIGVPRDMKLPSARLLRAYLNYSISFF